MKRLCFCVTGWHFDTHVYEQLSKVDDTDIYVVSHKATAEIPSSIHDLLPESNILVRPNLGYDWGCYQQFIATGLWVDYETVIFLHDDLIINNLDFVDKVVKLLDKGAKVVGNGRVSSKVRAKAHPYFYAHSVWVPPTLEFEHEVVRGSFLGMKSDTIAQIKQFEIFWDPHHWSVGYGNYSLIATTGRIIDLFGADAFDFLSDIYLESDSITELVRGEVDSTMPDPVSFFTALRKKISLQRVIYLLYKKLGRRYVQMRIREETDSWQYKVIGQILGQINGMSMDAESYNRDLS